MKEAPMQTKFIEPKTIRALIVYEMYADNSFSQSTLINQILNTYLLLSSS